MGLVDFPIYITAIIACDVDCTECEEKHITSH